MKSGFPLLSDIVQTLKIWQANLVKLADFSDKFSTYIINETRTGEFFLDDEAIYRKVIVLGSFPNAATKTVPHGISRMKSLIRCACFARSLVTQDFLTVPYIALTAIGDCLSIKVDGNSVILDTATGNYSNYTGYAILEYTKS